MSLSLKFKVTAAVAALALIGIIINAVQIHAKWRQIAEAKSLSLASQAAATISVASMQLTAERNLTMLSLSLDGAVVRDVRTQLASQRTIVDRDLAKALDALGGNENPEFPTALQLIREEVVTIGRLRDEADKTLQQPSAERSADGIKALRAGFRQTVMRLHAHRLTLRGSADKISSRVALLEKAQDRSLKFREYAGRDRTIYAVAVARQEPISINDAATSAENYDRALEAMQELRALGQHDGLPQEVNEAIAALDRDYFGTYAKTRDSILAASKDLAPQYAMTFDEFLAKSSRVLDDAEQLQVLISQKIQLVWAAQEAEAWNMLAADGATLLAIVAASLFAVWTTMRLFQRLDQLRTSMGLLANGDLQTVVPDVASRDEAGEMARAVKHFQDVALEKMAVEAAARQQKLAADEARERAAQEKARLEQASESERRKAEAVRLAAAEEEAKASRERADAIETIGKALARLAANDLTVRLPASMPEAYRKLMGDFNAAVESLSSALKSIREGATAIANGASEIAQASDDLSRRTESQAANLEETSAAVTQISTATKISADGAASARDYVAAARKDAESSGQIVQKAVEAMSAIETSSNEISQIIGLIDEIAFQTNLLALNAGVEAARAGEAGRGFAVVATEVRALAQRSAEAAKQIRGLITTSNDQVSQGAQLVGEAGEALKRIIERVVEINRAIQDVSVQAQEQATSLSQVSSTVGQMDHSTQQTAAMVEETTAATRSLSEETQRLLQLVNQFRTNDGKDLRDQLTAAVPHMRPALQQRTA